MRRKCQKKIRVKNHIWAYEKGFKQYKNDNFQELLKFLLGYYKEDGFSFTLYGALNCEVELIEDEIDIQEIKELNIINTLTSVSKKVSREENLRRIDNSFINNFYKINDLIKQQNMILQWVKQLDHKIKEKE